MTVKTMKVLGWVTSFLACMICPVVIHSQIITDTLIAKPLPRISGWIDNSHYLVKRYSREEKKDWNYAVNIFTGDEQKISAVEPARKLSVVEEKGDIYLLGMGEKKNLTNSKAVEKLPKLSPDENWVAFLRDNDLYVIEIATGQEFRFTQDGSETILNGFASWVYYEEILGRGSEHRAFWWAPDSKHIAFFRFDDSVVPVYPLINFPGNDVSIEYTRYPKAGEQNPEVKVGVGSVVNKKVVWADFDQKEDQYFGSPVWRPDGKSLLVQWMPRGQNNLKLYEVNLATGSKKEIYNENQPTWINWIDRFLWVESGFVMVRDFDGWEQIYYHASDGRLKQKLTSGKNWRTVIDRVDEKTKTVYFHSNAENSIRTDLYSVQLDGTGLKRISFGNFSFSNFYFSPDTKHLITTYSNTQTPSRIALMDLANGKVRELANSRGVAFDESNFPKKEVVWLKTKDGFHLPGKITWPAKMDKNKKYPVIISIYGGPNYQAVTDEWITPSAWDDSDKVIRMSFAHRGSGDCGKVGLNFLYRNLGKWEMEDYIEWAKWLRSLPQVDTSKLLITGGSYGGYLTAMALTYGAAYFKYGIADYPVTDWRLYDSHYTERYMDQPKNNPDGYAFGAVITHVNQYQHFGPAMLLLEHGTMDDNVHIQNTYLLADTLQILNKPFEIMVYPGERHGWVNRKNRFTLNIKSRFMERYLFDKN